LFKTGKKSYTMKKNISTVFIGLIAGFSGSFLFNQVNPNTHNVFINQETATPVQTANTKHGQMLNQDFSIASELSTQSVVYIKTTRGSQQNQYNWFDYYFHGKTGQSISSGSGVIYSADGFIITNHHVIENASNIEVIHEKHSYQAKIVGIDPSTDLAILKIETSGLPAVKIGNSSKLKIGEWVLAVGNPFNLNTTVTAGIVSAKARSINVVNTQFPIESFIQTDAAINPGNSGGALVNLQGELVGINTAILSKTGSYTGYGFAVPADIVVKITNDLIQYGEVQKAFLGATISEINSDIAKKHSLSTLKGVLVANTLPEGAAEKSGLKAGDVILKINNLPMDSKSHFDESISYQSPGDKVNIIFMRGGQVKETTARLTNREGTTEFLKREIYTSKTLGADFEKVSKVEKNKVGIDHGIKIVKVTGGFFRRLGIEDGFIITHINRKAINTPEEIVTTIENTRGRVIIEGINSAGTKGYYSYYY
jgi:serine protease Do